MTDSLRVVFLGTPDFAVPALQALVDSEHQLIGLVCQPDRQRGRGRKVMMTPTKCFAVEQGVSVFQPDKLGEKEIEELRSLAPDILIVAAFGKILRRPVLSLAPLGCINIHASLLPKYRGAAPINWAIIRGETKTGITIMQMDEGVDTGAILLTEELTIGPDETAGELFVRMADLGGKALMKALSALSRGELVGTPQDDRLATLAPMLKKSDGQVDWNMKPAELVNFVRGLHPWPGAFTSLDKKTIKLHKIAFAADENSGEQPGTVLKCSDRLVVAAGNGAVELLELQMEGRKRMDHRQFLNGVTLPQHAVLGL